jgi:hypothetical protein
MIHICTAFSIDIPDMISQAVLTTSLVLQKNSIIQYQCEALKSDEILTSLNFVSSSNVGYLSVNKRSSSSVVRLSILTTTNLDNVAGLKDFVHIYCEPGLAVPKIRQSGCGVIISQSFSANNKSPNLLSTDSVSAWIVNNTSGNAALISSSNIQCHSFNAESNGQSCHLVSHHINTYLPINSSRHVCPLRLIRVKCFQYFSATDFTIVVLPVHVSQRSRHGKLHCCI